jgi:hypothetical protein
MHLAHSMQHQMTTPSPTLWFHPTQFWLPAIPSHTGSLPLSLGFHHRPGFTDGRHDDRIPPMPRSTEPPQGHDDAVSSSDQPSPPDATATRVSPLTSQRLDTAVAKLGVSTAVARIGGSIKDWWRRLQQR